MLLHYFALRVESQSVVAAEVSDRHAASLLERGEPVLLGTFAELNGLAQRLGLSLVMISRSSSVPAPRVGTISVAHVAAVA